MFVEQKSYYMKSYIIHLYTWVIGIYSILLSVYHINFELVFLIYESHKLSILIIVNRFTDLPIVIGR